MLLLLMSPTRAFYCCCRKVEGGFGGFKISGNANYLPYSDEELAQQQAEQAAKKG